MVPSDIRILVVDDDTQLLDLLVDTLDAVGYQVEGATDGIEALDKLKEGRYHLMITDIKMPGMDGITLLKKARRYYPDLPVLFITGYGAPEIIGRASADGFLAKPFRISHIEELIERTLAGESETVARPIRKVLIVDDDDSFREVLTDMLTAADYVPLAVPSAEEALKQLEYGEVDAVITDIKMPGMDGVELLKKVKQRSPELPVILITGYMSAPQATTDEAAATADGFLKKPFRIDNIISILKDLTVSPVNE
jgi:DNA-binding NtrC family response regulator